MSKKIVVEYENCHDIRFCIDFARRCFFLENNFAFIELHYELIVFYRFK